MSAVYCLLSTVSQTSLFLIIDPHHFRVPKCVTCYGPPPPTHVWTVFGYCYSLIRFSHPIAPPMYTLVLNTVEPYTLLRIQARSCYHLWASEPHSDSDELTHFRNTPLSNKLQIFYNYYVNQRFLNITVKQYNLADYNHHVCNRAAPKFSEGGFKSVLVWDCMWSLVLCSVDLGLALSARQTGCV
jgi:hypothetical protein